MTLILSGTNGLSDVDGSAATPAIRGTDTNTGIFFPAADTIGFAEGGVEAARFDSSGNFLVGTTSNSTGARIRTALSARTGQFFSLNAPGGEDWIIDSTNTVSSTDVLGIYANGATGLYIQDTGNVGIGTSSPAGRLTVTNTSGGFTPANYLQLVGTTADNNNYPGIEFRGGDTATTYPTIGLSNGGLQLYIFGGTSASFPNTMGITLDSGISSGSIRFTAGSTERARITTGGDFLFGTTSAATTADVGVKTLASTTMPYILNVVNTASGTNGVYSLYNTNATFNGTRFYAQINGGVANYSANNTNLSDERVKTNISLADGYLTKICAIPVKTFNYKDEPEGEQKSLGVIAQDVEAVAPELVCNDGFGETPEDGIPLKSIYQTDLQYALMKCIQELKAQNDELRQRVAALESGAK